MRPRVIPAEDLEASVDKLTKAQGFNEAAGYPRGRPDDWKVGAGAALVLQ